MNDRPPRNVSVIAMVNSTQSTPRTSSSKFAVSTSSVEGGALAGSPSGSGGTDATGSGGLRLRPPQSSSSSGLCAIDPHVGQLPSALSNTALHVSHRCSTQTSDFSSRRRSQLQLRAEPLDPPAVVCGAGRAFPKRVS